MAIKHDLSGTLCCQYRSYGCAGYKYIGIIGIMYSQMWMSHIQNIGCGWYSIRHTSVPDIWWKHVVKDEHYSTRFVCGKSSMVLSFVIIHCMKVGTELSYTVHAHISGIHVQRCKLYTVSTQVWILHVSHSREWCTSAGMLTGVIFWKKINKNILISSLMSS